MVDALRARTHVPRILRNQNSVEVLKTRTGEDPLATTFDDVEFHLPQMDRQNPIDQVSIGVSK